MILERNVIIEISGRCNGRCPWCATGRATREGRPVRGGFMPPETLNAVLDRLASQGLALDSFRFELFNWGEPLLHPRLAEIIEVMNRRGLHYRLSTNASVVPDLGDVPMHGLDELVVSMPGFSQSSYDAIHGFSFQRIQANIPALRDRIARNGFQGRIFVSFHIYQFNIQELPEAARFCLVNGLEFHPFLASLCDYPSCVALLSGRMDSPRLAAVCRHLLLSHLDAMLRQRPADWQCWQQRKLVIDEEGRLLTCCVLPRDHPEYSIGSVFDLDLPRAMELKTSRATCRQCLATGAAYWLLTPVRPPYAEPAFLAARTR